MITTISSQIRFSAVSSDQTLSLSSIVDQMQDCCTEQSMRVGQSIDELLEMNLVWMLSGWDIKIIRRPRLGESIKISTWPHRFRRYFAYRCHLIETEDGEPLVYANSEWFLMNTETGHPTVPSEEMQAAFPLEERLDMPFRSRKIHPKGEAEILPALPVQKHQIDSNHHVNNSQYIVIADDCLPEDFRSSEIRVEYRNGAKPGDVIIPERYENDEFVTVVMKSEADRIYAAVEFRKDKNEK